LVCFSDLHTSITKSGRVVHKLRAPRLSIEGVQISEPLEGAPMRRWYVVITNTGSGVYKSLSLRRAVEQHIRLWGSEGILKAERLSTRSLL
jgi:hypothetical protein